MCDIMYIPRDTAERTDGWTTVKHNALDNERQGHKIIVHFSISTKKTE
jgi:hypothetical protein